MLNKSTNSIIQRQTKIYNRHRVFRRDKICLFTLNIFIKLECGKKITTFVVHLRLGGSPAVPKPEVIKVDCS